MTSSNKPDTPDPREVMRRILQSMIAGGIVGAVLFGVLVVCGVTIGVDLVDVVYKYMGIGLAIGVYGALQASVDAQVSGEGRSLIRGTVGRGLILALTSIGVLAVGGPWIIGYIIAVLLICFTDIDRVVRAYSGGTSDAQDTVIGCLCVIAVIAVIGLTLTGNLPVGPVAIGVAVFVGFVLSYVTGRHVYGIR